MVTAVRGCGVYTSTVSAYPASTGAVRWMVIMLVARGGEWREVYGGTTGQGTGWDVPREEQKHMKQGFWWQELVGFYFSFYKQRHE